MKTVEVKAKKPYAIKIGSGLLASLGREIRETCPEARTVVVVTDQKVGALYLQTVIDLLEASDFTAMFFSFPEGEQSKNGETYLSLLELLGRHQVGRKDVLLALGGGVVGDLTGFAAATYLRGVSYIQVPTTLLAAVDSSVGGKTAIDLQAGKNLVGAFHQPALVLCDTDTLETLPREVFYDGCAEVIKYGMIGSESLLKKLETRPIYEQAEDTIVQCVSMKRDIVQRDEFDEGERQLLNLGHTLGHSVESLHGYSISHGKAVAIGMSIITRAAVRKGCCPAACLEQLQSLLSRYNLPVETKFSSLELYKGALKDKKRQGDTITIVVPTAVGKSELLSIPIAELFDWIEMGREG